MNEINIIKKYFPLSSDKILNVISTQTRNLQLAKSSAEKDPELEEYILTKTRNLNLKVNLVKDAEPNAFVMLDQLGTPNSIIASFPFIGHLYNINNQYLKLLKANIDGYVDKDGVITFTHKLPSNRTIETYQTSGLKKLLKNDVEARFAILLHEIGHLHSVNPYLFRSLIGIVSGLTMLSYYLVTISDDKYTETHVMVMVYASIVVISSMIINYIMSINEANCDKFANKLGYGNHISRALFKMLYPNGKANESDLNEIKTLTNTFSGMVGNFITKLTTGYPSLNKRIATNINEGVMDLISNIEFENILAKFDKLFAKIF
jgi:Zn-dependent protease with chaperone function